MPLLERILTPINALLPDISRVPQRRQAVGAIVASLVLHLILFLLFVSVVAVLPDSAVQLTQPEVAQAPLEVQIITPPEEDLVTPEELRAAAQRPVIDSTGLAKTDEAPKDAIFESDENMKAGSQQPATGDLPLPSQDGRNLPFPQFTNQNATLGSLNKTPSPETPEPPAPPTPPTPPVKAPKLGESKKNPRTAEAKATPVPKVPETAEPKPDEIAIAQKLKPRVSAPDLAPPPPPPEPAPERQEMAKLTTPSPKKTRQDGYQPEQMETRIDGNISNRGPKGVAATKTPLGKYLKQVKAQIGSRWHYYMEKRRDLYALGSARVSFSITKDGRVRDIRVDDNTSNEAFALMCQQCVIEAEIFPPPPEAEAIMPDGKLEQDLNFHYVPFQ